ncbi:anticodon-binding protein [Cladochytrium replicatum]|nr:anticodon-binding protein [Cladochytrium replicatum]
MREFDETVVEGEDEDVRWIGTAKGPTCHFKLTSIKCGRDIHGHGRVTAHKPEVILNNFNTRLGHTVGRQLAAFFPQVPEFKGRQVATFHNQRDFIFFPRHRYIFKDGKRCDLQELGPRFTLKLQFLQKGTCNMKYGEYEWVHRPEMDTSRRRFFL